ncbi:TPA: hypothetical protein DD449_04455 [Candidatus Berkelbacteria bacterium]|uniref:Uncharacterized protein n=1 Tax=Berkelbacteria bacterium GW2011_GWE1_39_12 TaxID=1618337 RepID=A0A0G4B2Z3_9BACT|nr:MAG: hypothetical protein UT28_C0001G0511 [Berkelbacteria bacterium GW2011_GWE1_39_12]HBO60907.1 hypothetical protein [Candidatus Berkelbacteria bacterium]
MSIASNWLSQLVVGQIYQVTIGAVCPRVVYLQILPEDRCHIHDPHADEIEDGIIRKKLISPEMPWLKDSTGKETHIYGTVENVQLLDEIPTECRLEPLEGEQLRI